MGNKITNTHTKLSSNELKEIDNFPVPSPTKNLNQLHAAIIENPSNKNEILIIGCGSSHSDILSFDKIKGTIVQNKVDLTLLEKNGQKIDVQNMIPNISDHAQKIYSVKVANSNSNKDHIVVLISCNSRLCYSIFDCKSYQWVYFNKDTNYIDEFENFRLILRYSLIAVQDYLIIVGSTYEPIHIVDIHDEMEPKCIRISNIQPFACHGCVHLATITNSGIYDNRTIIRLLLFGGFNTKFLESMHELEITFKIPVTGQQYDTFLFFCFFFEWCKNAFAKKK